MIIDPHIEHVLDTLPLSIWGTKITLYKGSLLFSLPILTMRGVRPRLPANPPGAHHCQLGTVSILESLFMNLQIHALL